jgi:hypothetical protein
MSSIRSLATLAVIALALAAPTGAFAGSGATLSGFGGLSVSGFQTQTPSLGGTVTFPLVPQLHVVGEVGRMGNVLPSRADTVFSFADTGLRTSAFYGEGGVRLIAAPNAIATPYGETTAGIARLDISSDRLGGIGSVATSIALGFVDRTMPVASVGGGLLIHGGPVVFDLGYRYKQLFANDAIQATLGLGERLHDNQVRFGLGLRF